MSERSELITEHGAPARSAGAVTGAPPIGQRRDLHVEGVHR
jgi:hypothetical protein